VSIKFESSSENLKDPQNRDGLVAYSLQVTQNSSLFTEGPFQPR
jgi:hypothetical protein